MIPKCVCHAFLYAHTSLLGKSVASFGAVPELYVEWRQTKKINVEKQCLVDFPCAYEHCLASVKACNCPVSCRSGNNIC